MNPDHVVGYNCLTERMVAASRFVSSTRHVRWH